MHPADTSSTTSPPEIPNPSSSPEVGRIVQGRFESYAIITRIQNCLYGHVMAGVGLVTGDVVAIKSLTREETELKKANDNFPETALAEVFFAPILRGCKNVALVREVVGCEDFHFIISDFANGEDLLELLKKHSYGLPEHIVSVMMRQAAEGLAALHRKSVALQDFSLENCLLSYDLEGECQVKVCDPGQAVIFGRDEVTGAELPVDYRGCVGKKFRPPEIFRQKPYWATKVDSWCLGWSVWYLLFATEVFESANEADADAQWSLFEKGRYAALYRACDIDENAVSREAKDFIYRLLEPEPAQRLSVESALEHPFLKQAEGKKLLKAALPPTTVPQVAEGGLPRMVLTLLSLTRDNDRPGLLRAFGQQLPELREALESVDLLGKPLPEVKSRARTIRRLLLEAGPSIPHIYFTHYQALLCTEAKPSFSLCRPRGSLETSGPNAATSRPEGAARVQDTAGVALTFRKINAGARAHARLSPRGLCATGWKAEEADRPEAPASRAESGRTEPVRAEHNPPADLYVRTLSLNLAAERGSLDRGRAATKIISSSPTLGLLQHTVSEAGSAPASVRMNTIDFTATSLNGRAAPPHTRQTVAAPKPAPAHSMWVHCLKQPDQVADTRPKVNGVTTHHKKTLPDENRPQVHTVCNSPFVSKAAQRGASAHVMTLASTSTSTPRHTQARFAAHQTGRPARLQKFVATLGDTQPTLPTLLWAAPATPSRRRHERDCSYRARGAVALTTGRAGPVAQLEYCKAPGDPGKTVSRNSVHTRTRVTNVVGVVSVHTAASLLC